MHICQINPLGEFYSPISGGAVATVIMETSRELIRRGHEVSVLSVACNDAFYSVGRVIKLPAVGRGNLSFLQRRLSALRRKIHGWDWHFYEFYRANIAAALRSLPTPPDVVIVHNDLVSPRYLKKYAPRAKIIVWLHNENRTNQKSLAPTVSQTDAFICVSDFIRDWTARNHSIPPPKLHTILNGVNTDTFQPRAELGTNHFIHALYLGRIDPNKGPDLAVDAAGMLAKQGVPIAMTVIGGLWFFNRGEDEMADPFFRSLKDKMSAAGTDYRGHVTRPDIPSLVRQQDIVCVLSRSNEPCGLVPLEAMASGCAVVASNRGGLPQVCGDAAILVNPEIDPVVEALKLLTTNPAALLERKQRSLEHARRNTWSSRVDQLEPLLKNLGGRN